jgi:hypothetical protein
MEAAMKTLYTLVSGKYPGVSDYLKGCIIVIDPCQNPDGHDLYTNRYRRSMNSITNPDKKSWEHNQGWPGARTNHFMFDLNRDWTWQTQAETQQRLILYNQFMPQVHADFHEMGAESTFFFAPGADPWNNILLRRASTSSIRVSGIRGLCLTERSGLPMNRVAGAHQVWHINLNRGILLL